MVPRVCHDLLRSLLFITPLLSVVCCSTYLNEQEEFQTEYGQVKALEISLSGTVYVATEESILQFQDNSISSDDLRALHEVDISDDVSLFQLFNLHIDEYLLRCNYTACVIHKASNISQFWPTETFDESFAGSSLGGEHSAQVVFVPCQERSFCFLYSAISGSNGTVTFSERIVEELNGKYSIYHRNPNIDEYIFSKPGHHFEFIYSFNSKTGFVYFLRNTLTDNGNRIAYISQMCSSKTHTSFRSYMESKMECNGYTTLTAALLVETPTGSVLIASFSGSQPKYPGTILCKFSMDVVENYFVRKQRDCFDGKEGSFPSWIEPQGESCAHKLQNQEIACGHTSSNTRIAFASTLKNTNSQDSVLLSRHTTTITSVSIQQHEHIFVVYLGMDTGLLEKILFNSSFGTPITVFRAQVSSDHGNIQNIAFSADGSSVFYMEQINQRDNFRLYMLSTQKCEVHSSCYGCLTDILNCIWIQDPSSGVQPTNGRCTPREKRATTTASVFDKFCQPLLNDVLPKRGPTNGGTVLTLTGLMDNPTLYEINNKNTRIPVNVMLGDVPCNVSDVTKFPERLECTSSSTKTTGAYHITLEVRKNITITDVSNIFKAKVSKGQAEYQPEFEFVDPELSYSGVVTESVKLSGNIQLTIQGENLDIGSKRRVLVGQRECLMTTFDKVFDNEITCQAPRQNFTGNYTIFYEVDNARVSGPSVTYISEPVIHDIQPRTCIASGGSTLTISGENLEGFGQSCQLHLNNRNHSTTNGSSCQISYESDNATLLCKATIFGKLPFRSVPALFNAYGQLQNLSMFPVFIVKDPVMDREDKVIPISYDTNQKDISFIGSSLANISKSDVRVTIGSSRCIVMDVHEDAVSCKITGLISAINGLKEIVKCKIGYRTYDLGTVAFQISTTPHTSSRTTVTAGNEHYSIVVVGSVVLCLVVIVVVGVGIKKLKSRKHRFGDERYDVHYRRDSNILSLDGLSENHTSDVIQNRQNDYQQQRHVRGQENTFVKETEPLLPVLDEDTRVLFAQKNLIIENECLVLGEIIGQGHFGCVYKGYFTLPNEKAEKIVACKTLHRNNPKDLDVNMFLKEALLMKDFHHNNVMELIGICLGMDSLPLVVLPFMRQGDLLSYIRDVNNKPTVKELVVFGVDIANGMHYLSQLKFIHRDLAARNCMIDDDMKVKVADFGLSRDVYEKEYYSSCDKKAQLPVKWMSPESLEFGLFTHKSDVWSFGVVLWELLTRGVNPYPTVDNWDILRYLKQGRRLNKPDFCPDEMYRIMQRSWNWNPDERPLFGELTIQIPELLRKLERASEKRKQLDTSY